MSVRVEHDETTNTYSLGADIDGVFIPFAWAPGDSVQARIAAVNEASAAPAPSGGAQVGRVTGDTGDDFNPDDFTDNGDGTYTRTSDGQVGRFGPAGFTPVTSS